MKTHFRQKFTLQLILIVRCKLNPCFNTPWHRVRPPSRDHLQTASLCNYVVLATSEKETAIKKLQIMLRTATNWSNCTNRVPVQSSSHQTAACLAGFLLKRQHSLPLSCSSFLLCGSPTSGLQSAVRNAQFCSFPCQLSIITAINWYARHIWTLIAFPWSNNDTFSSLSCGTLLHSVIDS